MLHKKHYVNCNAQNTSRNLCNSKHDTSAPSRNLRSVKPAEMFEDD